MVENTRISMLFALCITFTICNYLRFGHNGLTLFGWTQYQCSNHTHTTSEQSFNFTFTFTIISLAHNALTVSIWMNTVPILYCIMDMLSSAKHNLWKMLKKICWFKLCYILLHKQLYYFFFAHLQKCRKRNVINLSYIKNCMRHYTLSTMRCAWYITRRNTV